MSQGLRVLVLALLLLGGTALVGGVFSLLFGIPKSVSDPVMASSLPASNVGTASTEATTSNTLPPRYEVNTDLEQISDWLTKIMVGVGLTQ